MPNLPLFDAHCHIIDPRFPLIANQGFLPEAFRCEDYLERLNGYDLRGGAVVSGSFQGFDQGCLIDALDTLGPGFVGVTQLPPDTDDATLLDLHRAGVRALRFNLFRGGTITPGEIEPMALRVYGLCGWHVELYVCGEDLAELSPLLARLPAVSIDHLGMDRAALPHLLPLVEQGVRVKASGFGRVDLDVPHTLRAIHHANPQALMFGSDLPSTRARRPYRDADLALIIDTLGEEGARRVCHDNARHFYRLME